MNIFEIEQTQLLKVKNIEFKIILHKCLKNCQ